MVKIIVLWEDYVGDGGGKEQRHMILEVPSLHPVFIRKVIKTELGYEPSDWGWFTVYHLGQQVSIDEP